MVNAPRLRLLYLEPVYFTQTNWSIEEAYRCFLLENRVSLKQANDIIRAYMLIHESIYTKIEKKNTDQLSTLPESEGEGEAAVSERSISENTACSREGGGGR